MVVAFSTNAFSQPKCIFAGEKHCCWRTVPVPVAIVAPRVALAVVALVVPPVVAAAPALRRRRRHVLVEARLLQVGALGASPPKKDLTNI